MHRPRIRRGGPFWGRRGGQTWVTGLGPRGPKEMEGASSIAECHRDQGTALATAPAPAQAWGTTGWASGVASTLSRLELGPSWVLVLCNAMEISVEETLLLFRCASTVRTIVLKHGSKTAHFHLKMDNRVAPRHGTCLNEHPFAILWWPNPYETTTALIGNSYVADQRSS